MRFLLYNIAYGTGGPKSLAHRNMSLHKYLLAPWRHLRRVSEFVAASRPDVLGLVEVDDGSVRAGGRNQVAEIARRLSPHFTFSPKYHRGSLCRLLPILKHQGNGLFARETLDGARQHFLPVGVKRLVLEAQVRGIRFLLVHLALQARIRAQQIRVLTDLVRHREGPCVLAGDFNTFGGRGELTRLMQATGLANANARRLPTYPSWQPHRELDFVLCSPEIAVTGFHVLDDVRLSDHLPVVVDFHTSRRATGPRR
ncbi:MAG: hypothetical protein BWZ02_03290 [Lentisphaerae bacterium ADurb.BinA184]|nr:MAG: hypothetical protein BWZ02_03290 [Lentisphaerae bacterium ADurb.BinA184]